MPAQMFDRRVVVVPSAGRPTAVPLWVPALRAGGLRGGGMVSGRYDSDECLTPACHLTRFCSVRDSGMFTRVRITVTLVLETEMLKDHGHNIFSLFFLILKVQSTPESWLLTHSQSHLFTNKMLQMQKCQCGLKLSYNCYNFNTYATVSVKTAAAVLCKTAVVAPCKWQNQSKLQNLFCSLPKMAQTQLHLQLDWDSSGLNLLPLGLCR